MADPRSSKALDQLLRELGQSQEDRLAPELEEGFVLVDERLPERAPGTPVDPENPSVYPDLASQFAHHVNFFPKPSGPHDPPPATPPWPFVPNGAVPSDDTALVPPHLALFRAFLRVHEKPRAIINQLTGRHLDFFDQEILQLSPKAPVADRAHLVLELKKNAAPTAIDPKARFTAGPDATKVEMLYQPSTQTVINRSQVASLRSVYRDAQDNVFAAPVANSSDGLGAPLGADGTWSGFGPWQASSGQAGFAIASPVLRMAEGLRKVTLSLTVTPSAPALIAEDLAALGALSVSLTGAKNWVRINGPVVSLTGTDLEIDLTVMPQDDAIVDYDPKLHQYSFTAHAPIALVQVPTGTRAYQILSGLSIQSASVSVTIVQMSTLALSGDAGHIDPKQAFMPFGPSPATGSRFRIGCAEALSKHPTHLALTINWKNDPSRITGWYKGYVIDLIDLGILDSSSFTAYLSCVSPDGTGAPLSGVQYLTGSSTDVSGVVSMDVSGAVPSAPSFSPSTADQLAALDGAGGAWSAAIAQSIRAANPGAPMAPAAPSSSSIPTDETAYIELELANGFYQDEYRTQYVAKIIDATVHGASPPKILNPPWVPIIKTLWLDYDASTRNVNLASPDPGNGSDGSTAFYDPDVQFFHVAPFGVRRDHGWARLQLGVQPQTPPLLPELNAAGELYIGLSGIGPGDSASLLFEVADGSADPTKPVETLSWDVLSDNYWKALGPAGIAGDTTNGLLTSGIVQVAVPLDATTNNTLLPAGLIWIRVSVPNDVTAVCKLVSVASNALEVRFVDQGNDPAHYAAPLPAGSIAKLKTGNASIKTITQPYASFGGRPREEPRHFRNRVAERLRHKDRCVSPWDYERIVLEAFPTIHRVKCIPHSTYSPGPESPSWEAAGCALLIVIPDLRNRSAMDPLQPRADLDTLSSIASFVSARAGLQVAGMSSAGGPSIAVANPRYEPLRLDFKVKFKTPDFNYSARVLRKALVRNLSPWAFDPAKEINFGGRVYKSSLIDFVERQPNVDFVTDFRMYSQAGETTESGDLFEAQASRPDAILVSAAADQHRIGQAS